ncbi:MAG: type II secretion system minor pseudopilin GspI [Novosphingobium sp.]|nr:type II secretion system minor pseudopilin GspI [Novosphingobium sp.]
MRAKRPFPAREGGFTLLELLVALAVFAIAALTLLRMEGASIRRTADLDQRLLREVVAQNLAAEWLTDPSPPALGETQGQVTNAGRAFAFARRVEGASQPGVIRVVVSVREVTPGAPSQAFTLEFMRQGGV